MPVLETVFDSDASFDSNVAFDDRLAAHPNLVFWARSDETCLVTANTGRVTRVNSNPPSASYALPPGPANSMFVAQAAGRWPAVHGNGVNSVLDVQNAWSFDTPWTVMICCRPAAFGADQMMIGHFQDAPNRVLIGFKANGNSQVSQGNGSAEVPAVAGVWTSLIASFDGTSVFNSTNGVLHQFPSNGLAGAASTVIGGLNLAPSMVFNGDWTDILVFNKSTFLEAETNSWFDGMCRVLYGAPIA
jgi:hypothetical protein